MLNISICFRMYKELSSTFICSPKTGFAILFLHIKEAPNGEIICTRLSGKSVKAGATHGCFYLYKINVGFDKVVAPIFLGL